MIAPLFQHEQNGIVVKLYPVGPLQSNCTLIYDLNSKEAIVVDPGDDLHLLQEIIEKEQLQVKMLLHTHAHFDHSSATRELQDHCKGAIIMHQDEIPLYAAIKEQGAMFGFSTSEPGKVNETIGDQSKITLGENELMATLHTPGHTPGGCSFYIPDFSPPLVITGDTLFRLSIGRTDLPGGDYSTIIRSIKERLFTLPDDTVVLPGHGPTSTIMDEKRHNPFVREM